MRGFLVLAMLVFALLLLSLTLWAQGDTFTPSPHIYKIAAANCETGPAERVQSGFRVQNQAGIITALHGVLGCNTIVAEPGSDGQAFHQLIIGKVDIRHDVAVLWSQELADEPLVGLAAITGTLTTDGTETYQVIGYPFGSFRQKPTIDVKILERTALGNLLPDETINAIADRDSPAIDAQVLSVQAHLVPGHSGAPIFNQKDEVVGISNGGLDMGRVEMSWAIPWDIVAPQVVSTDVSQSVSWTDYRQLRQLSNSDSSVIFAYSTPEPSSETPQATNTLPPSASATHTSTPTTSIPPNSLSILGPEFQENTYVVKGDTIANYHVGDSLIVYGEISPGVEVAIALLKITQINPDSLSTQAILIHPSLPIRPTLRVDDQIDHLSSSELVPAAEYAIGYLLEPERIYLRPNSNIQLNLTIQALEYVVIGTKIVDALPFDPPIIMQVERIGVSGSIASVKLVEGDWPPAGTILQLVQTNDIASSQRCTFAFLVLDRDTDEPIGKEDISVFIGARQYAGVTDPTGYYSIELSCDNEQKVEARVLVSADGYLLYNRRISLTNEITEILLERIATPAPTSTSTPTVTPTSQPTATPTSVPAFTPTRPPTVSSQVVPSPTSTVLPTEVSGSSDVCPTGISITRIWPLNNVLDGTVTFEWTTNISLTPPQKYELVFWKEGENAFDNGFNPAGGASEATFVAVNLNKVSNLSTGQNYRWGVLLVDLPDDGPYRRKCYLGGDYPFTISSISDTPNTRNTPVTPPKN